MKPPTTVFKIQLDTPQGKQLQEDIKSHMVIDLEINEDRSMSINTRVDQNYVISSLKDFLAASMNPGQPPDDDSGIDITGLTPGSYKCEYMPDNKYGLTLREIEVMSLAADGKTNVEIAALLCISSETVKSHMRRIFKKYGVNKRINALKKFTSSEARDVDYAYSFLKQSISAGDFPKSLIEQAFIPG